jgi:predicted nucleic acid-binding protein
MKVVVDTNIVFSAILNTSSDIGKILISAGPDVQFYSCHFLQEEILSKRLKLQKLTKLNSSDLDVLLALTTHKIQFISERLLPLKAWKEAIQLTKEIDLKDAPFVALSYHLNAVLWSGDKKLRSGLLRKGFGNTIDTKVLLEKLSK